ncbi:hypothetical protein KOF26_15500 [Sphingomonas sp. XMGL2]|uniref:Uncharacterized protein n=2 Tax=Sphingomonas quercus TaxID=2842451 RepID=A0ABS6BLT7_9SPHN|nr:hypothetical protein [Sphingomonas quercus]
MTLEQSFPGLAGAPSGAVIGLANDAVDFFFGRGALTAGMSRYSNIIFAQIKAIDPDYRYDSLGAPSTHEGWTNQLNDMRFDRAVAFMRKLREIEPMKLETLRLMQRRADIAYEAGLRQLRAGKLNPRLSNEEALGNFVDREVRKALRDNFRNYGINEESDPVIRVNRRENSVSEKSYRRPDARVGDAAFDVTLTRKNLATPQVRGFFNADFRPEQVIIIRPRQLSPGSSYIITRPE